MQDSYARLLGVDIDEIRDIRAWLVVVVGRLSIDRLRLAYRQRETTSETQPDGTLQEAAATVGPADRVTLDDRVCSALHGVLERLTPAERTTFVLHDVFAFTFDDISPIVGRSPAACRQLASRARSRLHTDADAPRFAIESADERHICDEFIAACATGVLDRLLAVLDPDVAGQVDMGGAIGLRPPVAGSLPIAKTALHFWGPASGTTLHSIPTDRDAGLIALREGQLVGTFAFTLRGGLLHHIHTVVDPAKLAPLAERLGAKRP